MDRVSSVLENIALQMHCLQSLSVLFVDLYYWEIYIAEHHRGFTMVCLNMYMVCEMDWTIHL